VKITLDDGRPKTRSPKYIRDVPVRRMFRYRVSGAEEAGYRTNSNQYVNLRTGDVWAIERAEQLDVIEILPEAVTISYTPEAQ
jgi:hypothetical protein